MFTKIFPAIKNSEFSNLDFYGAHKFWEFRFNLWNVLFWPTLRSTIFKLISHPSFKERFYRRIAKKYLSPLSFATLKVFGKFDKMIIPIELTWLLCRLMEIVECYYSSADFTESLSGLLRSFLPILFHWLNSV